MPIKGAKIKQARVCYQHVQKHMTAARNNRQPPSTLGGIWSVATPFIRVVSACIIPDNTNVEFSGKSKYPIFLTKTLS